MANYYGDDSGYGVSDDVTDLGNYTSPYSYAEDDPITQSAYEPDLHTVDAHQDNVVAANLVDKSKLISNLADKENAISRNINIAFKWNTSEGIAPSNASLSKEAIAMIFGNDIDLEKKVYVHSIEKLKTYNSSPFYMVFKMHGIENKSVKNHYKLDGSAYAFAIPPGESNDHEIVFQSPLKHLDENFSEYGNIDLDAEVKKLGAPRSTGEWMQHENDFFGKLAIDHAHLLQHDDSSNSKAERNSDGGLEIFQGKNTRYVLLKQWQVNKLRTLYKEQVDNLNPGTRWSEQRNELEHFDHENDDKVSFGSASYLGNMSEAMKSRIESATQRVIVTLRVNLIDQKAFK